MNNTARAAILAVVVTGCAAQEPKPTQTLAETFQPGELHPDAPPETAALGQLVGVWDVEQQVRNQDGSWNEPTRAEWRWFYILDGQAIQDDWIKPPVADGPSAERTFGTNIRIYDPETDQWNMAWIDSNNRTLARFTAKNIDDTVVMTGVNPVGRRVQNTFYAIKTDAFEWVQEWTFDDGDSWVPVSRLRASRRPPLSDR